MYYYLKWHHIQRTINRLYYPSSITQYYSKVLPYHIGSDQDWTPSNAGFTFPSHRSVLALRELDQKTPQKGCNICHRFSIRWTLTHNPMASDVSGLQGFSRPVAMRAMQKYTMAWKERPSERTTIGIGLGSLESEIPSR